MSSSANSGKGARPSVVASFAPRAKKGAPATVPANLDPRFAAPAEPPRQFDANGEAVEIGGSDGPEPTRLAIGNATAAAPIFKPGV